MARRFEESTKHFNGSKVSSGVPKSDYTVAREQAMTNIYDLAKSKGISVDDALTTILKNSQPELKAYVSYKGETPVSDPVGLALQAALIRANDVATTSRVLDSDDETGLQTIEGAENDAIALNSPERDYVLTPVVSGALACIMQYMSEQSGGKSMATIVSNIQQYGKYNKSKFNSIDNIGDPSSVDDWSTWLADTTVSDPVDTSAADNSLSATSIGSTLASIPVSGGPSSIAAGFPTISTSASNLPQAGTGTSAGGVLNSITSIFSGITSVANSISSAAQSTTGAVGSVKGALSGVGASSIGQYVQQNSTMIILILIVIVAAIYFAVHAARK